MIGQIDTASVSGSAITILYFSHLRRSLTGTLSVIAGKRAIPGAHSISWLVQWSTRSLAQLLHCIALHPWGVYQSWKEWLRILGSTMGGCSFFCTISASFLYIFHFFVTKNNAKILQKNGQQNFCSCSYLGYKHFLF